ncbi:MAG TPA: N-acetylglucosamine-6-phosphate deacetylase, partial [Clostridiales bacterium]|nr:N-acetylglucosamine-6-phosphate deacetylase [Clostridiales bacterium]
MEKRLVGTVITPCRMIKQGEVAYENGKFTYVGPFRSNIHEKTEDMGDAYVAPGFIDIHVHGGGGRDFAEGTPEAMLVAAKYHAQNGTAVLLPTASTSPDAVYFKFFEAYKQAVKENTEGAEMPGLHMEGPNFALAQVGAQDPRYVIPPQKEWYENIYSKCNDILRWDVAAERDENMEFGRWLNDRGILASIGHSDATLEEAILAYESGYTHLTHFYSGMSALVRRKSYRFPGLIEAGYMHNDFTVEIIADGSHLPPSLLKHIYKAKGSDKIALITDALAEAGLPEGTISPP